MKHRFSFCAALVLVLISLSTSLSGMAGGLPPLPPDRMGSSIDAGDLRKHLTFLASDELGGRYALSPSNQIAARYLASRLESYGYRGAGRGGSFFQAVPLSFRSVDVAKSRGKEEVCL